MRSKVHETEIEPGLRDTVHDPYFIATRLVSQVIIFDAKVPDATIINDPDEDVFKGRCQDLPSHRTFTSKERHLYVNPSDISKIWHIVLSAATNILKSTTQRIIQPGIMPVSRQYRANQMLERPRIKVKIFTDTME